MKKIVIGIVGFLGFLAVLLAGAIGKTTARYMFGRLEPRCVSRTLVSFDRALVEASKRINATLPMYPEKGVRLDSTVAGPGKQWTNFLTLLEVSRDELDSGGFAESMRPRLIQGYKTNPDMAMFREWQVELHYHYRDKNGATIATIVVSPKDF